MGHILEALRQLELKQGQGPPETESVSLVAPRRAEETDTTAKRDQILKDVASLALQDQPAINTATPTRLITAFERSICRDLADENVSRRYERLAASIDTELIERDGSVLLTSVEQDPAVADTLAHLGVLLAERDTGDVLLVDANVAGKTLTNQFEAGARNGVIEILDLDAAWNDLVIPAETDRLYLLPAGLGFSESADAAPAALPQLFDQWKRAYRFVVVDAGDASRVLARALSRLCRAAYFHVQLGSSDSEQAASAVAQLLADGARLRGCVVSNAPCEGV